PHHALLSALRIIQHSCMMILKVAQMYIFNSIFSTWMSDEYYVIGAMSGTSLDGLDLCCAQFKIDENRTNFKICSAQTIPYQTELKQRLGSTELSAMQLTQIDFEFGRFIGQ